MDGIHKKADLTDELSTAVFGDQRLSRRLGRIMAAAANAPEKSFPQIARSDAELEATYRFLGNDEVTPDESFIERFIFGFLFVGLGPRAGGPP